MRLLILLTLLCSSMVQANILVTCDDRGEGYYSQWYIKDGYIKVSDRREWFESSKVTKMQVSDESLIVSWRIGTTDYGLNFNHKSSNYHYMNVWWYGGMMRSATTTKLQGCTWTKL
ncbi:hypothetical protein [Vibrio comitans]|uniref:Uncharacterized protein n=1 Tax=Vibrio comitans NBRC 102076 TaxID=1219078 RepID=A0A4Y3IPU3_9VIBR|nr:hypothetical protein [Vibrio comitans]GEA60750.1 hypothetical protein VCO01S_19430 [Vibrio comitans NBRC 102076]